ncbi:hypothetical protein NADFUDRAFT_70341 [Nadsonia fulvescens var. elongata DSM 6958]|uniref:Homeobox domain-containing protein n=1 Tax=Nadsonia fulvescens var. elongata DSM 6958 TaxID=857566 RepID=A0A1E3PKR9_9ASCO|nr:hypothetical protein NADFUDRAFT_70341 [Nadsonia fulvescens var. elongata DSM 6958]
MLLMPRSFISNNNSAPPTLPSSLHDNPSSFRHHSDSRPYPTSHHSQGSASPITSPINDSSSSAYSSKPSSLSSEGEGAYIYSKEPSAISQSPEKNISSNRSPLQNYSQGPLPSIQGLESNRSLSNRSSVSQSSEDIKLPGVQELLSLADSSRSVLNNPPGYKVSPTLSPTQPFNPNYLSTLNLPQQSQAFPLAQHPATSKNLIKSDSHLLPPVINPFSFPIESKPNVPPANQVFLHNPHLFSQSSPYPFQQPHPQNSHLQQQQILNQAQEHDSQEQRRPLEQQQALRPIRHQHNQQFVPYDMSSQSVYTALPEPQRAPFVHMGSDMDRSIDYNPSHRYAPDLNGVENNSVKPKRRRATPTQVDRLNATFEKTFFPSSEKRLELARELNMTPRAVQIWFQNKRQGWNSEHKRPVPK